jgi:hypothetical protein
MDILIDVDELCNTSIGESIVDGTAELKVRGKFNNQVEQYPKFFQGYLDGELWIDDAETYTECLQTMITLVNEVM